MLLVLGGLSARVAGSTEDNAWYQTLTLPALQPPGPVFGIAWSMLYTLIAVSAAIVWGHKRAPGRTLALVLFGIGVAINLTWSPVFFRFHLITAGARHHRADADCRSGHNLCLWRGSAGWRRG